MKKVKTKYPGVYYREHPTRRHGIKLDRYFVMRLSINGKRIEEACGWASEKWSAQKAANLRAELKENIRRGEGPRTLKEKRALEDTRRHKVKEKAQREKKAGLTFKELFEGLYTDTVKEHKHTRSWGQEENLFKKYIGPVIGKRPLKAVSPLDLERIKLTMKKKDLSPRTVHYALAVVRQVFNFAIRHNLFDGANPVSKVKLPSSDNRRLRFLTREEADALLAKLKETSVNVHDMALLSLHTGMRAGEIFSLTWGDVELDRGTLTLRDTKSGKTRAAFMTGAVKEIFMARKRGAHTDLVFPDRKGKRIERISSTFHRAVDALKLNEGIKDRRYRVCFHTLRHTYASWHVETGADLYAVKELLGHSDFKMTARYSHLGENTLRAAVNRLDNVLKEKPQKVMEVAQNEKR